MKIHEYQGKELFRKYGVPVPIGIPAMSVEEALAAIPKVQAQAGTDVVVVKAQIQTSGPLGLKVLARAAGFEWRDDNPSGEASMLWYESARESDEAAQRWRERILDYNEDDCRATRALRDWLNGAARELAHRDDVDPT